MSAGGFESPNYTQVPNDLFDLLMQGMEESELRVVLCLIRQTIGYHRDQVRYSISKICKMTGLSKNAVLAGVRSAEERGLIKRTNKGSLESAEWEVVVNSATSERGSATSEPPLVQPVNHSPGTKERIKEKELKKNILEQEKNEKIIKVSNRIVDGILESDRMAKLTWAGRESIPEPIRELLDHFVELTGIKPVKNNLTDWLQTGQDWLDLGIGKIHITEAYKKSQGNEKSNGFMVTRPGSLTMVAQAVKAQGRSVPQMSSGERVAEMIRQQAEKMR